MFPFKFEIKDAIWDYHKTENSASGFNNKTISIAQNEIFSIYLMFLDYQNRSSVLNYVEKINKKYYKINIPKEYDEYLAHLPKILYTIDQFEKPENIILELAAVKDFQEYFPEKALRHTVDYIKKYYAQYAVK